MIGQTLGHYRILDKLGAGGMGEVYRAEDTTLGREVAIKVLPEAFTSDPERLARFEREAKLLAALNDPHIAQIHALEEIDGQKLLVMELLEGATLRERLSDGPLPRRKVVDFALQIARGLAAAHEKGFVHRDLKPENLFLTRDGQIKILDFGLAKLPERTPVDPESETAVLTEFGRILGTVAYMSPEQVRGEPVEARSDIFCFGSVLYEMLAGQSAFRAGSAVETMNAILTREGTVKLRC